MLTSQWGVNFVCFIFVSTASAATVIATAGDSADATVADQWINFFFLTNMNIKKSCRSSTDSCCLINFI